MFDDLLAISHVAAPFAAIERTQPLASSNGRAYMPPMGASKIELVIRDNPQMHRFEAELEDGLFAIAEYNLLPGKIAFNHTKVPAAYEGKGIGSALIRFALASARERGLKVRPICPFFAAYIKRHPEEQDLLDSAYGNAPGTD